MYNCTHTFMQNKILKIKYGHSAQSLFSVYPIPTLYKPLALRNTISAVIFKYVRGNPKWT